MIALMFAPEMVVPHDSETIDYSEIQEIVGGDVGYIFLGDDGEVIAVNKEVQREKTSVLNKEATSIARNSKVLHDSDSVYGDVVMLNLKDIRGGLYVF
jgi:hypothetical protein